MTFFRRIALFILPVFLASVVFTYQPFSSAKTPAGFSQPFGLLVHNRNREDVISRIKTLEVLLNYYGKSKVTQEPAVEMTFEDVESGTDHYQMVYRGCQLELFDCTTSQFNPEDPISQKHLLIWFFKLYDDQNPDRMNHRVLSMSNDYLKAWLEARRLNLLPEGDITNEAVEDLLYRHRVVEAHFGFPYQEGMQLDYEGITADRYHDLKEINLIQSQLELVRKDFVDREDLSEKEKQFLTKINYAIQKFNRLESDLIRKPYILRQRTDFPEEIQASIKEYGLQEVLYKYSYHYGNNASYRQHNVITGVSKMHGEVYQPGEVMDYWEELSDNHLSDFKYGWVIAGGQEKWQFGGGICGSSSIVFNPSWKAGLEIVERKGHSKYYGRDLYPIEDIGLDSTVYMPRPNLKIRNNFNSPILFNVINDKENKTITVEVIGNPIYKNIEIEGPIFVSDRHVRWIRHMEDYNGHVISEPLDTVYNKIYR